MWIIELISVERWRSSLKAYVSEEIFNCQSLRHSLNSDLCIHFYWLSRLRLASCRKKNQSSAIRLRLWLCHFKISSDTPTFSSMTTPISRTRVHGSNSIVTRYLCGVCLWDENTDQRVLHKPTCRYAKRNLLLCIQTLHRFQLNWFCI